MTEMYLFKLSHHDKCVSNHGSARPQVADGGNNFLLRRLAANVLNKQSLTAEKGGPVACNWAGT